MAYNFNGPRCIMYWSGTQNISHNTFQQITTTPVVHVDSTGSSMGDTGNNRINIVEDGDYLIGGTIRFTNPGISVNAGFRLTDGTSDLLYNIISYNNDGASKTQNGSTIWPLSDGDFVRLDAYWSYSGGSGSYQVLGGSQAVKLWAIKLQ